MAILERPGIAPRIGGVAPLFIPPSIGLPRTFLPQFSPAGPGGPGAIIPPSPLPVGGRSAVLGTLPGFPERGSPLMNVMRAWNRRAESLQRAGMSPAVLTPIAQEDITNVMQGRGALTNIEAAVATRARMGQNVLSNPNETDEGGGLFGFIGDIGEDIAEIGANLNPVKLIPALAEEVVGFFEALPKINFTTEVHSPGEAFKNLSEIPGLRMLPGVTTGYRATHDPSEISQHPVGTLLDILPLAMAPTRIGAKMAATPDELGTALMKGKIAHDTRVAGMPLPEIIRQTPRERILETAIKGRPLKTAFRAWAPMSWQERLLQGTLRFKERVGVAPWQRGMARGQAITERTISGAEQKFLDEQVAPLYNALDEADQALFLDIATHPNRYPPGSFDEAKFGPLIEKTRKLSDQLAGMSYHFEGHELFPFKMADDNTVYYANAGRQKQFRNTLDESAVEQGKLADLEAGLEQRRIELEPAAYDQAATRLDQLDSRIASMVRRRDALKARGVQGTIDPPTPLRWKRATQNGRVSLAADGSWALERHRGGYSLWRRVDDPTQIEGIRRAGGVVFNALDESGTPYAYIDDAPTSTGAKGLVESRRHAARLATEEPPIIYPKQYHRLVERIERATAERRELKQAIDNDTLLERNGNYRRMQRRVQKQREKVYEVNQRLLTGFITTPPANYQPMIAARIAENVRAAAETKAASILTFSEDPAEIAAAQALLGKFDEAWEAYERTSQPGLMGLKPSEYNAIKRDAAATWLELAGQGYQPIWVHSVMHEPMLARQISATPKGTTFRTPGQLKDISLDPTPRLSNVSISMTAAAGQYLQRMWHEQYILNYVAPYARSIDEIMPEINRAVDIEIARRGGAQNLGMHSAGTLFWDQLDRLYVKFTPDSMFNLTTPKIRQWMSERGEMYIPRQVADTAKALVDAPPPSALAKAATRVTSIFKIAVLGMSPKHMSDVLFSDTVLMALRGSKETWDWSHFVQAWQAAKNGGAGMPKELPRHQDLLTPDQLTQVAKGKTVGRIAGSLGAVMKVEEFVNNVQRMMSFLGEQKRLLKEGADGDFARQAALEHAQKTMLDLDAMTPIERTIIKQVFPFYSFMRYILNYVITYPLDHPIRASILSNFARMEAADRESGLPGQFDNYFFLGDVGEDGNITGIDVRSMNPFRDVGNFFTFAGFAQQLHPVIGGLLKTMGVNPLTGTPEMYAQLEYNPRTGRLEAQRKPTEDAIFNLMTSVFPQLELLDYYGLLTQQMRQLKAANPDAYKRVLYRILFLPFTPREVNVGEELQKKELAKLEAARRAYSSASRGQGISLEGYDYIPYRGSLYPAEALTKMLDAVKYYGGEQGFENIVPSALLGSYRR